MFEIVNEQVHGPLIRVIGVGGAGGNAVNHMIEKGVGMVEFIAVNTDAQVLARNQARNQIQIGTSGLGAGAKPEAAKAVALAERDPSRGSDRRLADGVHHGRHGRRHRYRCCSGAGRDRALARDPDGRRRDQAFRMGRLEAAEDRRRRDRRARARTWIR
jgi:hypothetical protein